MTAKEEFKLRLRTRGEIAAWEADQALRRKKDARPSVWNRMRWYRITCREMRLGSFVIATNMPRAVAIWRKRHRKLKLTKLTVKRVKGKI